MDKHVLFRKGVEIKRSSIHDHYGGNRQSGISVCAHYPYIFIFSGKTGEQYGYYDEWFPDSSVFQYTGEGKIGPMVFERGNLALRDHLVNGKRVFQFEATRKAYVRFIAEVELIDFDYFQGIDEQGQIRPAIKFFFQKAGSKVNYLSSQNYRDATSTPAVDILIPNETERSGLVTSRVGQGAYRKGIIHRWQNKCAVTGYNHDKVLIASHIVPWRDASDKERMDVNNGILLSPTYDALFDKHLISFGDDGEILLSKALSLTPFSKLGVTGQERVIGLNERNVEYIQRHRVEAGV